MKFYLVMPGEPTLRIRTGFLNWTTTEGSKVVSFDAANYIQAHTDAETIQKNLGLKGECILFSAEYGAKIPCY